VRYDARSGKEGRRAIPAPARFRPLGLLCLLGCLCRGTVLAQPSLPIDAIKLQPGFSISIYTDAVPGARSMTLGEKGTIFVGTRDAGRGAVYGVVPGAGRAAEVVKIASGLDTPNGVAFRGGALYVAEISRVLRFDDIENRLKNPPKPVVVTTAFPKETHHGWKFIAFGPDGLLYVPVGAPCNICSRPDPYAAILRMKPDGAGLEVFARGIRNTVGFDWHPQTKELWFTDNGRDRMGDDVPPDELNRAPKPGLHFGYPYCHAGVPDPDFGKERACSEFIPPEKSLGPHVAALGMRFYTGSMFPEPYRNQIFIAEHGSWNRSKKIGYRVSLVTLRQGHAATYETFASGWLQGESAWGRPVDLLVLSDGSLLVSDDKAGAVYRITFGR